MPEIDRFSGIRVCVFSRDHLPPHFHVFYGEHEALVDIREGTVIRGYMPPRKLKVVLSYLAEHHENILSVFYDLNPTLSNSNK